MRRVVLAMSGGVDSSVAAHLLLRMGLGVIGVTFRLWRNGTEDLPPPAIEDARSVCGQLGIPHRVVDFRDEFYRLIVERFCAEYFSGRTPNPCVRCNPLVKFALLLKLAEEFKADHIATGHYANVELLPTGRYAIRRGADHSKDQSYVLYGLRQEQLARCLFPMGTWKKPMVRILARELGFKTYNRPDSQEICFLGGSDYGNFLTRVAQGRARAGPILDSSGKVLGRHGGIHLFTLGQRKKLGIALGKPMYVVRIEPDTAAVVVGPYEETLRSSFLVSDLNWMAFDAPSAPFEAEVKIRYTHKPVSARIEPLSAGNAVRVVLSRPESAVTPGQAAVFYQNDVVLGGGTIERTA